MGNYEVQIAGTRNTQTAFPSVDVHSGDKTIAELIARINAAGTANAGPVAYEVPFRAELATHPTRAIVGAIINGSAGQTALGRLYLVDRLIIDGVQSLKLKNIGEPTWTAGSAPVQSALGGASGDLWASSVALANTGALEARTRAALGFDPNVSGSPAEVHIYDKSQAVGCILLLTRGSATSVRPYFGIWQ
jgi:hypothetical protein